MEALPHYWLNHRAAGVLAHVTSLPGEFGVGNLGASAHRFVDFLAAAGFRYWQICPIGPTGYGDSPYQIFSGSAGNPYFIDLQELRAAGLIDEAELAPLCGLPAAEVDYGGLYALFWKVLAGAHDRFAASGAAGLPGWEPLARFRAQHAGWLEPFADFMALKAHFGGRAWPTWPDEYRRWSAGLRARLPESARRESERHAFYQYVFFGQWKRLRDYAARQHVGIIGDVPIFVALDSADTWNNREVFLLDTSGQPRCVAGVPPDYFSALGQLWGNPLYDWEQLRRTGYEWWIHRLQSAFELYDIIRLDHFRGFDTYWEIPAGAPDARTGAWRKGPGADFFHAVQSALPDAKIIAEDLGYIGPDVVALRSGFGLPGMRILQFAYGHDANNANLPHFYPPNSVAYTGTHDNITTRGWLESLTPEEIAPIQRYFQVNGTHSAWPMIRHLLATVSRLAVVPMQDLLDLPAAATLNRPGTNQGNWKWRFTAAQLEKLAQERLATLREWITLYDRSGRHVVRDFSEPVEEKTEGLKS